MFDPIERLHTRYTAVPPAERAGWNRYYLARKPRNSWYYRYDLWWENLARQHNIAAKRRTASD